jgi:hypothetical protein
MANADVAGQPVHMALPKYVPDESIAFALSQPVIAPGDDTCSVLTTVLHHGKRVIQRLTDCSMTYDSSNTAHIRAR